MTINKTLLKKRADKEYDQASLEQTEKFSYLSPDFTTLWNYRREILTHMFSKMEPAQVLEAVVKENHFLAKSIMRSPKSYTLWLHREWVINKGLEVERELQKEEKNSGILDKELRLIDQMLGMDERNFHAWNYRS